MDLHLHLEGGGDLTVQLYRQLREAVIDGRLRPGDRLPSSRELATRLAVARGTVATAYERMAAEGFLTARVGAGTYVADHLPDAGGRGRPRRGAVRPRSRWTYAPSPVNADEVEFDFRAGVPDAALFPFDSWRRLVSGELRIGSGSPGRYADPAGHAGLRSVIARHIGLSRAVRCDADDVLVTNGTQHALDLVARVVLEPGDTVAVENPGYPPAATLLESLGMRVVPVSVDGEGLVVDRLPPDARLVYTTPSHQFPLGVPMSLARRAALVSWADRHDALVVEDDYDTEFRFTSRPLEPLVNLDPEGRVCYVGSFSKTMLPTLRLGFVVSPPSLRSALRAARQLSDGHSPVASQAALARFLDEGMFARHVRRAAGVYAARHTTVVDALAGIPGLRLVPSTAGLHLCALLPHSPPGTGRRVVAAARRVDVAVEALEGYVRGPSAQGQGTGDPDDPVDARKPDAPVEREGLVVGYGAVASDRVEEGLRRLVHVLRREVTDS